MLSILKLITKITKLIIKKVRAYIDKKIFKDLVLKEFENYKTDIDIPEIEFLIYFSDSTFNSLKMWLGTFLKSSKKDNFGVVVRGLRSFREFSSCRVFPISSVNQFDYLFKNFPNLKAIFYVANNKSNPQVIRNNQYTHIFIGHGDSFKHASAHKVFRLYDEVWTAGDAHIDRFNEIEGDFSSIKFFKIGQPWLEQYLENIKENKNEEKINIGYFPTWSGFFGSDNFSSLGDFNWIYSSINKINNKQNANLFLKMHPRTKKAQIKKIKKITSNHDWVKFVDSKEKLNQVLSNNLKFAIVDNSAALIEVLYLNIPMFLYVSEGAEYPNFFDQVRKICYEFSNEDQLIEHLNNVISNDNDYKKEARKSFLYYVVDINAMENNQFDQSLIRLSKQ